MGDSLPRPLRHPDVLQLLRSMDQTFYEGKLTGAFGLRFHYHQGVLRKIKVEHPEHEITTAEIEDLTTREY